MSVSYIASYVLFLRVDCFSPDWGITCAIYCVRRNASLRDLGLLKAYTRMVDEILSVGLSLLKSSF